MKHLLLLCLFTSMACGQLPHDPSPAEVVEVKVNAPPPLPQQPPKTQPQPAARENAVMIRVANQGDVALGKVIVKFPSQTVNYGNVSPGKATAYRKVGKAYRYAFIETTVDGKKKRIQPIDYLGERLLVAGKYTYALKYLKEPRPRLALSLERDSPAAKAQPRLEGLAKIRKAKESDAIKLDLSSSNTFDLTPLQGLAKLERLNLYGNQITDVSPLAGLTKLETLILAYNQITDLTPLAGLTNLKTLFLQANPIPDEQKAMIKKALPKCALHF